MLYIAFIIALAASFLFGYYFRGLYSKIEVLEIAVKAKVDKPKEESTSNLIDPLDEVQEAIYAQERLNKKLNP